MILEVNNLTKRFGTAHSGFTAVDNITFGMGEGEIVGLLGPNGAGKTTTIHMLLDVLTPTSGEIRYFGLPLTSRRSEIMSKVNFSSTYAELPWRLSVFQNLYIIAMLYNVDKPREKVFSILETFGMQDLAKERTGMLSAGQKTKVFLAKAFLNDPKILLLDEPTASLDPDIANKIRKILRNQQKQLKTSILITSHNMAEVEELCDRVIFIHHGKVIAQDTPSGLARRTKLSSVKLTVVQGMSSLKTICHKHEWEILQDDRLVTITIDEKNITELMSLLGREHVEYSSISIEHPSLEDFFLSASTDG